MWSIKTLITHYEWYLGSIENEIISNLMLIKQSNQIKSALSEHNLVISDIIYGLESFKVESNCHGGVWF